MNTTEINGGTWSTKYFGIVAGPLTVIIVLLPLVALPLIDFLLRFLAQETLRQLIAIVLLVLSLVANLQFSIKNGYGDWSSATWSYILIGMTAMPFFAMMGYVGLSLMLPVVQAMRIRGHRNRTRGVSTGKLMEALKTVIRPQKVRLAVFVFLAVLYVIGYCVNSIVSVVALVLYFVYTGATWCWGRRRKEQSTE